MEELSQEYDFEDYSLSQTTLEQVLLRVLNLFLDFPHSWFCPSFPHNQFCCFQVFIEFSRDASMSNGKREKNVDHDGSSASYETASTDQRREKDKEEILLDSKDIDSLDDMRF